LSARARVLIAGRLDGWMRPHLEGVRQGFLAAGAECELADYRGGRLDWFRGRLLGGRYRDEAMQRRTDTVVAAARRYRPDAVLTYAGFDFARLREGCGTRVVFWDWDGLLVYTETPDDPLPEGIDALFTISQQVERTLRARSPVPSFYLPHGVDLGVWSPGGVDEATRRRFGARLCFVGQPSPRRLEHLEAVADLGLGLWGKRWRARTGERLRECARGRRDVIGDEVVQIYRSSDVALNVQRHDLDSYLSVQVFHAAATGSCLVTEHVSDLDGAFEPGKELLAFRSKQELRELAERCLADPGFSRRIGEAARRRCEAEHSIERRARLLLDRLRELD
jgi:glycosyltransferase involved in cell wall biosynthesis